MERSDHTYKMLGRLPGNVDALNVCVRVVKLPTVLLVPTLDGATALRDPTVAGLHPLHLLRNERKEIIASFVLYVGRCIVRTQVCEAWLRSGRTMLSTSVRDPRGRVQRRRDLTRMYRIWVLEKRRADEHRAAVKIVERRLARGLLREGLVRRQRDAIA
jgi:hypothetical protein